MTKSEKYPQKKKNFELFDISKDDKNQKKISQYMLIYIY